MRQIVLDTETTGIDPNDGHRIIEIGCVELVNRKLTGRHFHVYINPEREVEQGAIEVHGITNEMLADKPVFSAVAEEFVEFVRGAELVIHNAPFDVGFLDMELGLMSAQPRIRDICGVLDTLVMARQKHPGQRNSLDALCQRYFVDNSQRDLHGALLDAEILADVYLAMTGGQTNLALAGEEDNNAEGSSSIRRLAAERQPLRIVRASEAEMAAHKEQLDIIEKASGGQCLWRSSPEG